MPLPTDDRSEALECSGRILVVDDNQDVLATMTCAFESYGYRVQTSENATEAILWAMTNPCDVILVDYEMPGMDGVTLTAWLRELLPATTIIGMSGRDLGMVFLLAGANDFMQKPFSPYDLVMKVDGRDLPS